MKFLSDILNRDSDYSSLLKGVKNNRLPLACTGLSSVHKSAVISSLQQDTGKKLLVITPNEGLALEMGGDLSELGVNCLNFPQRDYCIGEIAGYSKEYEHKRIDTLSKLLGGDFDVLTVSLDAALQYTVPPEILKNATFEIASGDTISTKELTEKLIMSGYCRSDMCDGVGTFSVRGGIFDIYPADSTTPYRLEFWGDEIDTISPFDTETQRRSESVEKIKITPACEIIYNPLTLLEKLDNIKNNKKLTEPQKERINADYIKLQNSISVLPDRYLPLIYPENNTIFEYLKDPLIVLTDTVNIKERFESITIQTATDTENFLEEGLLNFATAKLNLSKTEFYNLCENALILENFPRGSYELQIKDIINFNYKRSTAWSGDLNVLLEDITYTLSSGGSALVLAGEEKAAKVLTASLQEKSVNAIFGQTPTTKKGVVTVSCGGLSSGFEIPSQHFILITHRYIKGDKKRKKANYKKGQEISSLDRDRKSVV